MQRSATPIFQVPNYVNGSQRVLSPRQTAASGSSRAPMKKTTAPSKSDGRGSKSAAELNPCRKIDGVQHSHEA